LKFFSRLAGNSKPLPKLIAGALLRRAQNRHERQQCASRKALTRQDRRLRRILAFAGRFE
ncbi:MAG TPA: hypothetical protein VIW27_02825, partial [Gammaproteobacteria bacterium]